MSEETFGRALTISADIQEQIRDFIPFCIRDVIADYGGLRDTVLQLEENYGAFIRDVETFSGLPEVTEDATELRYLGVVMRDFNSAYTVLRGMAAQLRDRQPIDQAVFGQVFLKTQPLYYLMDKIIQKAFGQDFYGMIEQPQG